MPLGTGRAVVPSPPAAPPRTGLVASARKPQDPPGLRWQSGFAYAPENCAGMTTAAGCAVTSDMTIGANRAEVDYDPVLLVAGDKCSTFGFGARDYDGRARRLMEAATSKLLAAEFWKGTVAKANNLPNNYLARIAANTLTNGPVNDVDGLACLEAGLAAAGVGRKMIHCTPSTLTHWMNAYLITQQPGSMIWTTAHDTIVVSDDGYDGSSPDAVAARNGSVWAYGTDIVDVRLDTIEVMGTFDQQVDRLHNLVELRAQRLAAATWDGCAHVAVELNENICADPGGS